MGFKKIDFFKWEKVKKRKYQIMLKKIFKDYEEADKALKNLNKDLELLDIKDKEKVKKFKERSKKTLFNVDAFMYWAYYLNLDQKKDILQNNNILYKEKFLYEKKLGIIKENKSKETKEEIEKHEYEDILKKYNNKINYLIQKASFEKDKDKKLKLIIDLEYVFYEIQKELNSKNINLEYNPYYFNPLYMEKIISEIKKYNNKLYKKYKKEKKEIEKNFVPKRISVKKLFNSLVNSLEILGKDYTKKIENALSENRIDYFNRENKKQENHMNYNRISIMGNLRSKDIFILSHEISHMLEYEFKDENKIDLETEVYAIVNEYLSYIFFQNNKIDEEDFFEREEILKEFKIKNILRIQDRINGFQIIQKMFELFENKEEKIEEKLKEIYKEELEDFLDNISLYNPYLNCIYIIAEFVSKYIAEKIYKGEITAERYLICLNKTKENSVKNKYINLKKYLNIDIYDFSFLKNCIEQYFI